MSSSRKKKTAKQLKTYLAILLPVLAVLVLLALILTLGRFTAAVPEETEPPSALAENPYSVSDFEYKDGYLTCTAADTRLGIDVSEHQQAVDWSQVKAAGIDFVMIRMGYRGYTEGKLFLDSSFASHYLGARAAGLDVGFYFFSQATSPAEAREEAEYLLSRTGWLNPQMGIVYDWEYISADARTGTTDGATVTECAIAFCETIAAAGHRPMVYFNPHQVDTGLDLEKLTPYGFWLAMYSDEMTFPWQVDMWQYTAEGAVPGIDGPVDINLLFP